MTPADAIRRWVYCRCRYARSPTAACACIEASVRLAERESRAATARWEERLAAQWPLQEVIAGATFPPPPHPEPHSL